MFSAFSNNNGLKRHALLLQNGASLHKDVKAFFRDQAAHSQYAKVPVGRTRGGLLFHDLAELRVQSVINAVDLSFAAQVLQVVAIGVSAGNNKSRGVHFAAQQARRIEAGQIDIFGMRRKEKGSLVIMDANHVTVVAP